MEKSFTFLASFGGFDKQIFVDMSNGFVIYLKIDGIEIGMIIKHTTGWEYIFHRKPNNYTTADFDALDDRIFEHRQKYFDSLKS